MKKYGVSIPITGYLYVEVEAETEKEAIIEAKKPDIDFRIGGDLYDWGMHDEIVDESLVFHGVLNKIVIEELDEES